ncbi:MAG: metallopeptidase family protein [Phycisphaerales bacterium]|nr:metallopeptidase family protein [Phycisphaerales bacterium]
MTPQDRQRFDALLEQVIKELPAPIADLLDEVPVIVLDRPDAAMLADLDMPPSEADELCGLHTGTMATERSIDEPWRLPSQIHLFRVGIVDLAGGFDTGGGEESVKEQIRITLLHEIGHEFGLDEDQLWELGYD